MSGRSVRALLILLITPLLAMPAMAQFEPNQVWAEAACSGGAVTVSGGMGAAAGIDADWQGWVIARTTIGTCTGWAAVSPVQAVPDSGLSAAVEVSDVVEPDQAYRYGICVVTAGGELVEPPASVFFWPEYHHAYVACGEAPMVRARLHDLGYAVMVERCPDACWAPVALLGWDQIAPYESLVGTDVIFELSGTVSCLGECGMEEVTDITIRMLCEDPVAVQRWDWSAVKATFR